MFTIGFLAIRPERSRVAHDNLEVGDGNASLVEEDYICDTGSETLHNC